jgi:hypothetical protein
MCPIGLFGRFDNVALWRLFFLRALTKIRPQQRPFSGKRHLSNKPTVDLNRQKMVKTYTSAHILLNQKVVSLLGREAKTSNRQTFLTNNPYYGRTKKGGPRPSLGIERCRTRCARGIPNFCHNFERVLTMEAQFETLRMGLKFRHVLKVYALVCAHYLKVRLKQMVREASLITQKGRNFRAVS